MESCGYLSLAGVDPHAASEADARLDLGAVYTALLTLTPEQDESLALGHSLEREIRRLSALEQLNRQPRLVLLGDPGSGKSTFVNFVALCLSGESLGHAGVNLKLLTAPLPPEEDQRLQLTRQKEEPKPQPWAHGALLPVRVVLRDFAVRGLPPRGQRATAKHLWDFIVAELTASALGDCSDLLQTELIKSGGLLLLDGLDEVPEANQRRAQIKQAVEDFAAAFRKCRVLVTSRTYAYQKQDWRLAGFAVAVLAPFSDGQIGAFVERWYTHIAPLRNLTPEAARGGAALLQRAISNRRRLHELAERPLLLTLMASLHAWRGGSLPEKREELYADAVDLLLEQWERPKAVRDATGREVRQPSLAEWLKVDRDNVRALLNELAFKAHAAQPAGQAGTADILESDLISGLMSLRRREARVNPAELVDYLSQRAGLLLPRGAGVYTFPHRTFQEYLAACHLTDYRYPYEVAHLARGEPNRWREVALLAGAKTARGGAFGAWALANCLCAHEPTSDSVPYDLWGAHLAGQLLVETIDLGKVDKDDQPTLDRVRRWLIHILQTGALPALERAHAGTTLAALGDTRPGIVPADLEALGAIEFCYVPPGPFVMGEDQEEHTNQMLNYGYWLARYPVTVAQWRVFVRTSGHKPQDEDSLHGVANRPLVNVTWHEALAFFHWLTKQFKNHLPSGYSFILPSEAAWEKAARGGLRVSRAPLIREMRAGLTFPSAHEEQTNPASARAYPWAEKFDPNLANVAETEISTTSTVGCFPGGASPYGVQDLIGNVWEWTRSLYGEWDSKNSKHKNVFAYPYDPRNNRENLKASDDWSRVVRGGAFNDDALSARCAFRFGLNPNYWNGRRGFRVVASPFRP